MTKILILLYYCRIMTISNLQSELDIKKSVAESSKVVEELKRENDDLRADLRKEKHLNQVSYLRMECFILKYV